MAMTKIRIKIRKVRQSGPYRPAREVACRCGKGGRAVEALGKIRRPPPHKRTTAKKVAMAYSSEQVDW